MPDIPISPFQPQQVVGGEAGPLPFDQFTWHLLAQGDSWFSVGSLKPEAPTTNLVNELVLSKRAAVVNCAFPGAVLHHMTDAVRERNFLRLLGGREAAPWHAILLSGGGNDLIDAIGVAPDAQRRVRLLLRSDERRADPAPADYVCEEGWATFTEHLSAVFDLMLQARHRSILNRRTPLFLHTYAQLTPRDAGAGIGSGPWLQPALIRYGVPSADWPHLADEFIDRLAALLKQLVDLANAADPSAPVVLIDTEVGVLDKSDPQSTGSSGDFVNEIHPTRGGYQKLARVWRTALEPLLP